MPIKRAQYVDSLKVNYMLTWSQIEQVEFDKKLDLLFTKIEEGKQINSFYKQLAVLRGLLDEKVSRANMIIQTDILIEMVACLLIREDEDASEVNEEILAEKVATFKKKVNYQFLKQKHILDLMGLSEITESQFEQLWEYSTKYQTMMEQRLSSITKS